MSAFLRDVERVFVNEMGEKNITEGAESMEVLGLDPAVGLAYLASAVIVVLSILYFVWQQILAGR